MCGSSVRGLGLRKEAWNGLANGPFRCRPERETCDRTPAISVIRILGLLLSLVPSIVAPARLRRWSGRHNATVKKDNENIFRLWNRTAYRAFVETVP